jgi:alkanesulfonate monooxygenase SsuD/methylene tetrahydromethanopterin reductase-like flavin-dependent oxidoreductase (luciferase family)
MEFAYFHLMPYTASPETTKDWPVPNHRFDPEIGHELYTTYIDNMAYAEECGFDWVGCNEHHMSPFGMMANPNIIGASLIQRTKKIKIAMVGNLIPLLNPLRVAEEYAMLDVLSGGRLIAGMFRGIPHEYVAYNVSPSESYDRLLEATQLIIKAWTEPEPFGWEGEFYQYRAVSIWPRPIQKPHPRIIMSGSSKRSAEIAGQFGAMFGIAQIKTMENARELIDAYKNSAREHGWEPKPSDILVGLSLAISEDADEAKEMLTGGRKFFAEVLGGGIRTAQQLVLHKSRYYDDEMKGKFIDARKAAMISVDDLIEAGTALCGTPEQVVEQLRYVESQLGHGVTNINMKTGNIPDEAITAGMKMFQERVMPAFQNGR